MSFSDRRYRSWGFVDAPPQAVRTPAWIASAGLDYRADPPLRGSTSLAFGRGRSYGDSCLNSEGELIDTRALDRLISFDRTHGLLCAEPGVTLGELLRIIVPAGWFLPVSPGTAVVTLGGAVANDVHGKNQHVDGTIGRHVERLTLLRSSGERLVCSPDCNPDLYCATIGGLGLTGFIADVTLRLLPVASDRLDVRTEPFQGIAEFVALSAAYRESHRYSVAWLDCAASGKRFGRGVFFAANHVEEAGTLEPAPIGHRLFVPFSLPSRLLNRYTIRAFNLAYRARQMRRSGQVQRCHYQGYFYPLDAIEHWNRIYGRRGFHQYQFVLPPGCEAVFELILGRIVRSGAGSFLAVLKTFGDLESPGLLSFPRPGVCLALDFADRGAQTEALIRELDQHVMAAGGAVYPAKDRLMTRDTFRLSFPDHDEFSRHVDPRCSSDFWRRVSG